MPPSRVLSLTLSAALGLIAFAGCSARAPAGSRPGDAAPETSPANDSSGPTSPSSTPEKRGKPPRSGYAGIGGPVGEPPVTLASFHDRMVDTICATYARCCPSVPGPTFDFSLARCREVFHDGLDGVMRGFDPSTHERYVFDQLKAEMCLVELRSFDCRATPAAIRKAATAACAGAVVGRSRTGESCRAPIDCTRGHWCDAMTGTCASLSRQGQSCDFETHGNEQCGYKGAGPGCDAQAGTCSALLRDGEACYPAGGGSSAACASGLCDPTTMRCAALAPLVYPAGTYPPGLPPEVGPTYEAACAPFAQ